MSWVAVAIGGSAVLGFMGSQNAADAQSGATAGAIAEQRRQYDQNRADLAPYRSAGQSALQALLVRLGLTPTSTAIAPTRDQFTKTIAATPATMNGSGFINGVYAPGDRGGPNVSGMGGVSAGTPGTPASSTFDQTGFDAATAKFKADQAASTGARSDPNFGSLLKPFTGASLTSEPGYQFGLTEGEKAINRLAASRGAYFSGGTAKDAIKYNEDYAGTKYNDAYNRDAADKTRTASLLSGVAGTGQSATNTGVAAGTSGAGTIADLMTQGGNASAAGTIGGVNAINSGVGTYLNYQNQNNLVNALRSGTRTASISPYPSAP